MKKNNIAAILMILLGVVILLGNSGVLGGEIILFIISLGFFLAYFFTYGQFKKGNIGFLIPACILLMIGSFAWMDNNLKIGPGEGGIFFFMLGCAFFLIYFIHNYGRKDLSFGERNWPAITGGSICAFGMLILLLELYRFPFVRLLLQNLWPIGLILAGIIIIYRNYFSKKS